MIRVLLAILLIAEVAACPYRCAAAENISHSAAWQSERTCSCCSEGEADDEEAPRNADPTNDCCGCFCDGYAIGTQSSTNPHESQSAWIATFDPALMPTVASRIALEHDLSPPGDHSGRDVRLAIQSLLL